MNAKHLIFSALTFLCSGSLSEARNSSSPPSDAIIVNTLQCEAGRVGRYLKQKGLPQNLQVGISWKSSNTNSAGGGWDFPLPIFSSSGSISKEDLEQFSSDSLAFNLYPDNYAVCTGYKVNIIKEGVGLYDCLVKQKFASLGVAINGGTGSTGCEHKVTLTKKLSAGTKIPIWGASLGPNGSWGDSYVFDFVIAAPLRKK